MDVQLELGGLPASDGDIVWKRMRLPHHDRCFMCSELNEAGLKLVIEIAPGRARTRWVPTSITQGPPGWTHGGALAAVLDELMAYAVVANATGYVTRDLAIRYRRPTPLDISLEIEVRIEPQAENLLLLGEVRLPDGKVSVEATGIFVQVRR